jgi:hypothetical protein
MLSSEDRWPSLPLSAWADTCATLHMWTQIVGKVRLALAPPANHWWHVTLYVSTRGLSTSAMPYEDRFVEIEFDFVGHTLRIDTSDGGHQVIALEPMTVQVFYGKVRRALAALDITVRIWPMPVEVPSPIRFDEDRQHASYDAPWVERWWHIQQRVAGELQQFRGGFIGKNSPVHFFWGGFDLAVTRFSGRRAPDRPATGNPGNDRVQREAYSHEVLSAGFWPGGSGVNDAAFYAYAIPEPPGFKSAPIQPPQASYRDDLGEFILMYEDMRTSAQPERTLRAFLQTTYDAGASLAGWDRPALERAI